MPSANLVLTTGQGTVDSAQFGPIPPVECIPNTPDAADVLVGCDENGFPDGEKRKQKSVIQAKVQKKAIYPIN